MLDFIDIKYTKDTLYNTWIGRILSNFSACIAVLALMKILRISPFKRPQGMLYMIPCLLIAFANFPLISYLNGNMHFVRKGAWDIILFVLYCLSVGVLEELIFRGVLFSMIAERCGKDRNGLIKAFVLSSILFGLAHLTNIFRGAGIVPTLVQVLYSTLTGGLFCFALIKTKNLLCCAGVHALYNICGLLFETPERLGIGTGVVFDTGTLIMMALIDVCLGVLVLYSLFKNPEKDRVELYERLHIS